MPQHPISRPPPLQNANGGSGDRGLGVAFLRTNPAADRPVVDIGPGEIPSAKRRRRSSAGRPPAQNALSARARPARMMGRRTSRVVMRLAIAPPWRCRRSPSHSSVARFSSGVYADPVSLPAFFSRMTLFAVGQCPACLLRFHAESAFAAGSRRSASGIRRHQAMPPAEPCSPTPPRPNARPLSGLRNRPVARKRGWSARSRAARTTWRTVIPPGGGFGGLGEGVFSGGKKKNSFDTFTPNIPAPASLAYLLVLARGRDIVGPCRSRAVDLCRRHGRPPGPLRSLRTAPVAFAFRCMAYAPHPFCVVRKTIRSPLRWSVMETG